MKGLGFIPTVVAGLLTGAILLGAELWLSRPDHLVDAGRATLEARVIGGPWVPYPLEHTGALERSWDRQGYSQSLIEEVANGDPWGFAQIIVRNRGSAKVESIRFDLGEFPPEAVLIQRAGQPLEELDRPRELNLGALQPGETVSLYFWHDHNLASRYYYSDWQTFSTAGPVGFRYGNDEPDTFAEFAVSQPEFLWLFALFLFAVFMVAIGSAADVFYREKYSRRLLSDAAFYTSEKERFAADPVAFRANIVGSVERTKR